MFSQGLAPRSIGGVLDDAIRLWQAAFKSTLPLALMSAALMSTPLLWIYLRWRAASIPARPSLYETAYWPLTLFAIAIQLPNIAIEFAIYAQTAAVASRHMLATRAALYRGLSLMPRILLVALICALAGVVLMVPLIILLTVLIRVLKPSALVIGATATGLVAILGIIFDVKILMYPIFMVVENRSAYESLASSWILTRGHWWRVMVTGGTVTALYVVFLALCAAVVAAAASLSGVPRVSLPRFLQYAAPIGGGLYAPLFSAVFFNIYLDLKARKEGGDLVQRVEGLTAS
jgi:hypothetical protein